MNRFLIVFFASLFFLPSVFADTLSDPAYANMQRSMAGIMQSAAASRGFSQTDPRVYSTLYGMGTAATAAAATAGAGILIAGTSPAWGTILAVAAVSGAVSYGVSLGMDSLVKWTFGTPAATPISIQAPVAAGGQTNIPIYTAGIPMATIVANSINTAWTEISYSLGTYYQVTYYSTTAYTNPGGTIYTLSQNYTYNNVSYYVWQSATTNLHSTPCPTNYTANAGTTACIFSGTGTTTTALQTLTQAVAALTAAQNATALNDQTMAMITNYLWSQAAAQPGYAGIPYVASQPITQAQVDAFMAANPSSYPTVASLSTVVPAGSNGFYPAQSPTGTVSPASTATPPGTANAAPVASPILNLGADPVIGSPTLETPPDGPAIMAPILTGLAPYMSFSVSMPTGVCPAPTFDFHPVWNKTVSANVICTLYDSISPKIFSVMTLAWSLLFIILVLKA